MPCATLQEWLPTSEAHLEGFGGEKRCEKRKSELYKYLKKQGGLGYSLNGDDEVLNDLGFENDKNFTVAVNYTMLLEGHYLGRTCEL